MAQFRGILHGSRGSVTKLGHKKTGLRAIVTGWHLGITIEASHIDGKDVFTVYSNCGSNNLADRVFKFQKYRSNVLYCLHTCGQ